MDIKILRSASRFAVAEIENAGIYSLKDGCKVYLNGEPCSGFDTTIGYIGGLSPDTEYTLRAEFGGEKAEVVFTTEHEYVTLDVRKFGAVGDGVKDDTVAIQSAVMSCPENSRVYIPKGTYKVTNLFLKSNITIELAKDAVILADNERYSHAMFPGMIRSYDEKSEYNLGTWEGNPLPMFAGIITGIDVENVTICGEGTIHGNASHDDWWHDAKVMRGAFRPRLLFLNRCKNVFVTGVSFKNSPSWTLHPYFSENISFIAVKINNPSDSPNTDGIDVESCRGVEIAGVRFTLGDDCIAIKSGKIYMGRKYRVPSENIHIYQCCMEDGHGAVTLGSEISAGVREVVVESCIFRSTDRGLRIKTRRGRGDLSVIDNVIFRNINMENVKTPFVANCFYFCDPDGKTSYVQNREPLPVDERTPLIKRLVFENISCHSCHYAAAYFHGLPEQKIREIIMRNIDISFAENAEKGFAAMLCGIEEMCRHGIYAENVEKLLLENVSISGQNGEKAVIRNVTEFTDK